MPVRAKWHGEKTGASSFPDDRRIHEHEDGFGSDCRGRFFLALLPRPVRFRI